MLGCLAPCTIVVEDVLQHTMGVQRVGVCVSRYVQLGSQYD